MIYGKIKENILSKYPNEKFYHSANHITQSVKILKENFVSFKKAYKDDWHEGYRNKERVLDVCCVSILFHDIIYKVGYNLNEKESADYAFNYLTSYMKIDEIELVCKHILYTDYTKDWVKKPIPTMKFLRDIDWIDFAVYDKFVKNDEMLLNEAIRDGFDVIDFVYGKKIFLTNLLKDDYKIFNTKLFEGYNDIARKNIQRRLSDLNRDIKKIIIKG